MCDLTSIALTPFVESTEASAGSDDIDAYMRQLNLGLVTDKLKKKSKLLAELSAEYNRMSKLAAIAKPALSSLQDATSITPYLATLILTLTSTRPNPLTLTQTLTRT